jgi:thiopeptide-type bacteriocin biosynthesis protein
MRVAHLPIQLLGQIAEQVQTLDNLYKNHPFFREAIALASPNLHEAIQKGRSSTTSLMKYAIRSLSRATPFGLFSSVSWGYFDKTTSLQIDLANIKKKVKPTLSKMAQSPDECLMVNPQLIRRNGRIFLIENRHSIKNTSMIQLLCQIAQKPIHYDHLREEMLSHFSNKDRLEQCLKQLIDKGFLISKPSFTKIFHPEYENCPIGQGTQALEKLYSSGHFVKVDSYLDSQPLTLGIELRKTLEKAASLLFRLSYEEKKHEFLPFFLEKYGIHRLVPFVELLGKLNKTAVIQEALPTFLFNTSNEIDLEKVEHALPTLTREQLETALPSMEMFFELAAHSPEEIDRGNFKMILTGLATQGSIFGRFFDLWGEEKKGEMNRYLQNEEKLHPSICFVEATFIPESLKAMDINNAPSIRTYQLPLQFHYCDTHTLELSDLYIGATPDRLYIYSKKLKKEICITLNSAINPDLAPLSLRILLKISRSRFTGFSRFFWYQFGLSFPRVRYKNIILAPARWYFNFFSLQLSETASEIQIRQHLAKYFEQNDVPNLVYLTHNDHKLLLDWKVPHFFDLIVQQFVRNKEITLLENLIEPEEKVVRTSGGTHTSEFIVPMTRNLSLKETPKTSKYPPTEPIGNYQRILLPGSEWTYVKLFVSQENGESFLREELFPFLRTKKKWFYVQYQEERFQIRLRAQDLSLTELTPFITQWLEEGTLDDFSLHPYEREVERYGGLSCMNLVEEFFCLDSLCCSYFISENQLIPQYITAALGIIHLLKKFYKNAETLIQFLSPSSEDRALLKGIRTHSRISPEQFSDLFSIRDTVIEKLTSHIEELEKSDQLWNSKESIADSLIHMHCNRLMGPSTHLEKKARAAAFYFIQKWTRSHE